MSALRKTLMLFWILTLGMVAAFKYLVFSKHSICDQAECNRGTGGVGILTIPQLVPTATGQKGVHRLKLGLFRKTPPSIYLSFFSRTHGKGVVTSRRMTEKFRKAPKGSRYGTRPGKA